MARKPRKKRLSPDKVREKIVAEMQSEQEQHDDQLRRQAATTLVLELVTRLHAKVQAAAESDPAYLPLLGGDWYETLDLFNAHIGPLRKDGRTEQVSELMQKLGLSEDEMLKLTCALIALAFGAGGSGHTRKAFRSAT